MIHYIKGEEPFLRPKAIMIFRTSLENYIKLLNVYHIDLSNRKAGIALAETVMSDGSGDSAINSGFLEFKMLNSPRCSLQNFSPFSPAEGFHAVDRQYMGKRAETQM